MSGLEGALEARSSEPVSKSEHGDREVIVDQHGTREMEARHFHAIQMAFLVNACQRCDPAQRQRARQEHAGNDAIRASVDPPWAVLHAICTYTDTRKN